MSDILVAERDISFWLWEWLQVESILSLPEFGAHDRMTVEAMLNLSLKLAEETFLPHYKLSDQKEPYLDADGNVRVLPEIGVALREYTDLGLVGASFSEEFEGMGLPISVVNASLGQFMAANIATAAYPMLTMANARLITLFGSPKQIETFALPQIEGETFGTMCLSEPHAGSGLSDIQTRAVADGENEYGRRFRLAGNKMWITGGDQDITKNIIHLVLAKIPNEDNNLPEGTKGISLFIVPKWLPGDEGRNDIAVAGVNHKMGYRGASNCLLNFGEGMHRPAGAAGAIGYMVGEEGQGLSIMFQMMNEARITVGLGASSLAYRGYKHALGYARERVQGRSMDGNGSASVAIIDHPDVKRMLLAQKAYAEGAFALVLYCSKLVDEATHDKDAAELLALLTPIAKSWPSEWGLVSNELAIQVHGGYGYTRDFDVEQIYRDNRLNPIHEGTTGIQAMDLLGRKILRGEGHALTVLESRIQDTVKRAGSHADLVQYAIDLDQAWAQALDTIAVVRKAESPRETLGNATPFLFGFGHMVIGWLWLDMVLSCDLSAEGDDAAFYKGKHRACRFFFECELPKIEAWFACTASLSDVVTSVPNEQF